MKPALKKLVCTTVLTVAVLGGLELALRRSVPRCGVTPFQISSVPGLPAELRPGFTTLYKGHQVSLNSDGYRGPEFPPPQPGVPRIALVGDSFTFGNAIGLDDTLGVQLERALAQSGMPAQVLNLGVPGYCALDAAALVEQRALALEPDVVLYVFFANDLDQPQHFAQIPPDAVIDSMADFPLHSALIQWLHVRIKHAGLALGWQIGRHTPRRSLSQYQDEGGGERLRAALERMRDACGSAGVRLAMAVYPYLTRVDMNPFRPIDELALRDAAALGIEGVDLLAAFEGQADLSGYWASVFDSHPDGDANRRAAAYLAQALWP